MSNLNLLPECYGDTLLLEMLGFKKTNHQTSGIGQVIKVMKEKYANRLAVGLIDADKKITPSYFKEFQQIEAENRLKLLKYQQRNHYLIMVTPALEKFILQAAIDVDKDEKPFNNLKSLKRLTKSIHVSQNQDFKNFLNTLRQRKAPGFLTNQNWLRARGFHIPDGY
ncbi:MAG: hypothetical protein AAF960_09825 [Bacteroidota bacterium]